MTNFGPFARLAIVRICGVLSSFSIEAARSRMSIFFGIGFPLSLLLASPTSFAQYTYFQIESNASGTGGWIGASLDSSTGSSITDQISSLGSFSDGAGHSFSSLGYASATASIGSLGVSVSASTSATAPPTGCGVFGCLQGSGGQASATALFSERIFLQAPEAATLTFGTYISGSQSMSLANAGASVGGVVTYTLSLSGASQTWQGDFATPISQGLNYSTLQIPAGSSYVDVNMMARVAIDAFATASSGTPSSWAQGALSFGNTIHWAGLHSAVNAAGDDIRSQVSITSASNFDYMVASSPDANPPTAVPGPLPLMGLAAGFVWSRRIRCRIRQADSKVR